MVVMLVTGSANTLLMKIQTQQFVPGRVGGMPMQFDHPFVQTLFMCLGELLCLGVFLGISDPKSTRKTIDGIPKKIFAIPSLCDWTATTLVNAAYIYIPASIIQMTRGSIVLFVCIFSIVFLKKKQYGYHYAGVLLVVIGISLVSFAALDGQTGSHPLWGISLCILGQVAQASMLVVEESYLSKYDIPPLYCVGMEGLWGCGIGVVLLMVLTPTGIEHTFDAIYQVNHSHFLFLTVFASIISIAFFNWSGITVTKESSCIARATIDTSRTIVIWVVELALMWSHFSWTQLGGFITLAIGSIIYNEVYQFPQLFYYPPPIPELKKTDYDAFDVESMPLSRME